MDEDDQEILEQLEVDGYSDQYYVNTIPPEDVGKWWLREIFMLTLRRIGYNTLPAMCESIKTGEAIKKEKRLEKIIGQVIKEDCLDILPDKLSEAIKVTYPGKVKDY